MLLLGRDRLLAWADRAWQSAAEGHGRLLLLSGEAGIGKTSLARAIADHAAARGAVVRWGASWDGARVALRAWIDALQLPGDDACAAVAAQLASQLTSQLTARPDPREADPSAVDQHRA